MLDRYILHSDDQIIKQYYSLSEDYALKNTFNAKPTTLLPIISSQNINILTNHYWGQTPEWSNNKKLSSKLVNASYEEIETKKSLTLALTERRCIIPCTGFVLLKQLGKKTLVPYLYHLPDFELFSMAGLWEEYSTLNDEKYIIFKLITTSFNGLTYPLIIEKNKIANWLALKDWDKTPEKESYQRLNAYSISPIMNNMQPDAKELINHVPPMDQKGNYTLFS